MRLCDEEVVDFKPYYANMLHQAIFVSYAGKCSLCMVLDTSKEYGMERGAELMTRCFEEELAAALATSDQ